MASTYQSYITYMTLVREPKTQIAGITMLGDISGITRRHVPSNWNEAKLYAAFMRVRLNE